MFLSDFTVFTAACGCMGKFMWFLLHTCIINRVADITLQLCIKFCVCTFVYVTHVMFSHEKTWFRLDSADTWITALKILMIQSLGGFYNVHIYIP